MSLVRAIRPGAAVAACLAAMALLPGEARSQDAATLPPAGWFQVPGPQGTSAVNGIHAANRKLYFVFATGPMEIPARSAIVETDLRGNLFGRIDLPGARVDAFAVDLSGVSVARVREGDLNPAGPAALMLWDSQGALQTKIVSNSAGGTLAFHLGRPFAVDRSITTIDSQEPRWSLDVPTELGLPGALAVLPQAGGETILVSTLTAAMAILDRNRMGPSFQLSAPEIQGRLRDAEHGEMAFFGVASDGAGHVFCGVAPFNRDAGPVILEYSDTGVLLKRVVLTPPALPQLRTRSNPNGIALPHGLAAANGRLFALAGTGFSPTVVWYDLAQSQKKGTDSSVP